MLRSLTLFLALTAAPAFAHLGTEATEPEASIAQFTLLSSPLQEPRLINGAVSLAAVPACSLPLLHIVDMPDAGANPVALACAAQ